ncbi:glutathione synthetase ATP-binding domain-like protein [Stipitochalara longipes BDJ]|nr:glutathione synthetase ATP-binding domain-like protein [Stipitochalara longipes BDJ]
MKILLTDASGLTSRQVSTILSQKHHEVHVLSPPGIGITKLTSHTFRCHPVPAFSNSPYAWLDATLSVLRSEKFDILLCTQEQVFIVSAEAKLVEETSVKFAVPDFESLRRVMDKVSACQVLSEAGLPQPESVVLNSSLETLSKCEALLPGFVKTPIGTGSTGVRRAANSEDLASIVADYVAKGYFDNGGELLVQKEIQGNLLMVCGIYDHGRLRAWHACLRVREGIGGGASKKLSLPLEVVGEHLQGLGRLLNWHGALSFDAILEGGRTWYIDINPRIVEPTNGLLAGVDLLEELLQVSLGNEVEETTAPKHGIEGVETHQLLLAIMKATEEGRMQLLGEAFKAVMGFHEYAGSREELTPLDGDVVWVSVGLAALFLGLLVLGPWLVRRLNGDTISNYSLSQKGWKEILAKVDAENGTQDPT